MLLIFIIDYLTFEHVHLYTYDIFCERIGWKLIWGCFCWYPFFYCIGAWTISQAVRDGKPDITSYHVIGCLTVYCAGWFLTRGANL
jgi:delta14-sterol reductase